MAVTTVTIDGTAYDVYINVATATTYLAADVLLSSVWETASNQEQALVSATRYLDRQTWQGAQTDPDTPQPLEWPRTGVVDRYGDAVDSATVPAEIDNACATLAALMVQDPSLFSASDTGSNVKKAKAGSAEIEFFKRGTGSGTTKFPTQVHDLVGQFLSSVNNRVAPVAGGTDQESRFKEDEYGLYEGH